MSLFQEINVSGEQCVSGIDMSLFQEIDVSPYQFSPEKHYLSSIVLEVIKLTKKFESTIICTDHIRRLTFSTRRTRQRTRLTQTRWQRSLVCSSQIRLVPGFHFKNCSKTLDKSSRKKSDLQRNTFMSVLTPCRNLTDYLERTSHTPRTL